MAVPSPGEEVVSYPAPNYVNPENSNVMILGWVVPWLVLAVIFMAVRIYARAFIKNILGWDDYVMLVAMAFGIPVNVFTLVSLKLGLGLHFWDQKLEWHTPYSKLGYSADLLFPTAVSLTKISLCLTYLRLFPNRSTRIFCYVMSGFVILFTIICLFLSLFQCTPIRGYWDLSIVQRCINMRATLVAMAALNSFSDFCVYLWPAKPLWSLQMPIKQRLGLILLFSVGLLVCIAGVLRMYFLELYFQSNDPLWIAARVWTVMCIEINMGIICGCLSGVKPVLQVLFPRFFGSSNQSRRTTHPSYVRSHPQNSHQFQTLSGKSQDKHIERAVSIEELNQFGAKDRSNIAWATSNGRHDANPMVPANAIGIEQVVIVEEEEAGTITPPRSIRHPDKHELSDSSSEEWILHDRPQQHGA